MHSPLSLAFGYKEVVTHGRRSCNRVVVRFAGLEDPVLRIFARVLVAVFVAIAVAAAVFVPSVGLLVGAVYLLAAAVFAYAGFSRGDAAIVRIVVAATGSLLLLSGLLVALAMSILGFPFEGRGWVVGLAHAAFGGLTMACAVLLPCEDESAPR
jgi:hypothetical protein